MTEPKIVPSLDQDELIEAIQNLNLQDISIVMDWLYKEWRDLDEFLEENGHPFLQDGTETSLIERVKELLNEREGP
jgi:hypothetical protein